MGIGGDMKTDMGLAEVREPGMPYFDGRRCAAVLSMKRLTHPANDFGASTADAATGGRIRAGRKAGAFGSGFSFGFTERGIASHAPGTSGVYGIFNEAGWIYVGEGEDIKACLYSHLRGDSEHSYWIRSQRPSHFAFEECDETSRGPRSKALIAELDPVCNGI
jgi:hypothetical protein